MSFTELKPVMVKWSDSARSADSWVRKNDFHSTPSLLCVTCGLLKTDVPGIGGYIEIIQSIADEGADDEQYLHSITIPNCAVMELRTLVEEKVDT